MQASCDPVCQDRAGSSHAEWVAAAELGDLYDQPTLAAAAHTAIDLVDQGWAVQVDKFGAASRRPEPTTTGTPRRTGSATKSIYGAMSNSASQACGGSSRAWSAPTSRATHLFSIFNLMRDGRELAAALEADPSGRTVINPYVQVVDDSACAFTGFKLHDIWRYFRHTWSNAYATIPGRSMPILVRDGPLPITPSSGSRRSLARSSRSLSATRWMGWETDQFLADLRAQPTAKMVRWIAGRIKVQQEEIYVEDLLRDGVLQPTDLTHPSGDVMARLKADAERHRQRHHRSAIIREVRNIERDAWVERAETDLFRGKRSAALAEALEIRVVLGSYFLPKPSVDGLERAFEDARARAQLRRLIRRARGERVGTVIADLTVCGAIAPYNTLAAGKLVGALAVSPTVLAAYREKYARPSEIASAMAGRPIVREARLSLITTTSLYGTGSSQYNRLFWPADVLDGQSDVRIGFHDLGRSRSFGTSHFTNESVEALLRLSCLKDSTVRVNSLFGEGVSPRLRKVRLGLAALGWPTDELLKHGRERILYGVPLVSNVRDYSLGIDKTPEYLVDVGVTDGDARLAEWWLDRWALRRAAQERVQEMMRSHRLVRPVHHGARVPLPDYEVDGGHLPFAAETH